MRGWTLAGVVLASVCGCASAPRSPSDLADVDIERFQFGLYRDCVTANASGIEPPSVTRAVCDCVYDELGSALDERAWRQTVFLFLAGQEDDGRRLLAPYLRAAGRCRRLATIETPGSGASAAAAQWLVGTWSWTRPLENCREIYHFRADGTLRVDRRDERTESAYAVAPLPEMSGRYRVTLAALSFAPGADCKGAIRDAAGGPSSLFVLFGPRNEMIAVCGSPDEEDCDGPLRKFLGN